ncbi:IclR family transcriptional regulator [Nocardioides sp. YIM 152315]|uniref:IclR family transcriptional regulator n=1 Tax=Nocardioides sp. YIM 152315 TaxID=3031760 RepID=UPI0023DA5CA1|nr:IclR family transcriptional regulator [Nocardioides sp. YIM 152315]MDF1604686.1 IclR family transcriptional regulator [Nocardioides sp. YIM 152315]
MHLVADESGGSRASVLERATWILDLFLSGSEVSLLEDIARETGLPRSTAFRLVTQLVDLGWLVHDSRGGYRLGTRAHALGARTMSGAGGHEYAELRSVAAPLLTHLHRHTRAAVHLGVLEGGYLYYLDKIGGIEADQLPSRVGSRVVAHHTAMGRALLATLPPEQVDSLYAADPPRGPLRDLTRLHQELATARARKGVMLVHADSSPIQVAAVAAPVPGLDEARAAIGLTAPEPFRPEACAPLVLAAARRIGHHMEQARRPGGRRHRSDASPTISA